MTSSIIRRFARYHGVLHVDILDVEGQVLLLGELIYGSHGIAAVSRIIQSLTRIEDAEALLASAATHRFLANENVADSAGFDGAEIACRSHADDFLRLAGVDPAKWREVKE